MDKPVILIARDLMAIGLLSLAMARTAGAAQPASAVTATGGSEALSHRHQFDAAPAR